MLLWNEVKKLEALEKRLSVLVSQLNICPEEAHGERYHLLIKVKSELGIFIDSIRTFKTEALAMHMPRYMIDRLDEQMANAQDSLENVELGIKAESYAMLSDLLVLGQNFSE